MLAPSHVSLARPRHLGKEKCTPIIFVRWSVALAEKSLPDASRGSSSLGMGRWGPLEELLRGSTSRVTKGQVLAASLWQPLAVLLGPTARFPSGPTRSPRLWRDSSWRLRSDCFLDGCSRSGGIPNDDRRQDARGESNDRCHPRSLRCLREAGAGHPR